MQISDCVSQIRQFNRFYTDFLGLLNQHILESDFSLAEARLLFEINRASACTSADLHKNLNIDSAYVSRILQSFQREGIIEKHKSASDARCQLISLSAKGKAVFAQLNEKSAQQMTEKIEKLSFSQRENLIDSMNLIASLLGDYQKKISLTDINIRTELKPGDMGNLIYLHAQMYAQEYGYGLHFEGYVATTLHEFIEQYNPENQRVWVCEYLGKMIGFMLLMNRGKAAQLRYFIILPEYRGIGLGKKMMDLFLDFLQACRYESAYLWTTNEQQTAAYLYRKAGFKMTEEMESERFDKKVIEQKYELLVKNNP
jgi:DNA-binding MarR family transcriptional regulator/GNAT superfamily N-acetyltransferase